MKIIIVILFSITCMAQLPDAPSAVVDRNFLTLASVNAAATIADAWTTAALVGRDYHSCSLEVWNPELYGRRANDSRVIAVMAGEAVAATSLSYLLKRKRVHLWKFQLWTVPLTYEASIHARGAIHNLRTC